MSDGRIKHGFVVGAISHDIGHEAIVGVWLGHEKLYRRKDRRDVDSRLPIALRTSRDSGVRMVRRRVGRVGRLMRRVVSRSELDEPSEVQRIFGRKFQGWMMPWGAC